MHSSEKGLYIITVLALQFLIAVSSAHAQVNPASELGGWVGAVAFQPEGKLLATGSSDGLVRLSDGATAAEVATLRGHSNSVTSVAFSPDGTMLASASFDGTARLWHVATRRPSGVLRGHRGVVTCVAYSNDGSLVATGGIDGTVRIWDPEVRDFQRTLLGHKSWVNCLAFQPGGKLLASGSSDGTIRIWPADVTPKMGRQRTLVTLPATKAEVRSIAFSPDGKLLAAGLRYGFVRIWETDRWSPRKEWTAHDDDVWAVAFTSGGKALASGNGGWDKPGQVKLWEPTTGRPLVTLPHTGEVLSVAISPNGRRLAVGGGDKRLQIMPVPKEFW